jgi:hypothetical protein
VFAQGATAGVRVDTLAPVIPLAHYAE